MMTDEVLSQRDIARLNLELAQGLPGSEKLDLSAMLRKLDDWAAIVQQNTARYLQRRGPNDADLSDNQFRMLAMVTTLHKLGVHYNVSTLEGEANASDSRTQFIHGLLTGFGGTCVTMPVLYAAIGRRLGYPIKLAFAMEHVFCRWDDGHERFNIEATARGFVSHSDDEYLVWPKPIAAACLESGRFLRNLSRREELALFFGLRGDCCLDNWATEPAIGAYAEAYQYSQDDTYAVQHDVARVLHDALTELRRQADLNPAGRSFSLPAPNSARGKLVQSMAKNHFRRIMAIHGRSPSVLV